MTHWLMVQTIRFYRYFFFQEVNKAIHMEYLRRVFEAILENDELEKLQPRIGSLFTSVLISISVT